MNDLISRLSLKQSVAVSLILGGKKTLEQIIDEEPSVDAVLVIRCEDCKCKDKYENFCRRFLREIDPSDYCSYGEGKES